VSFSAIVGFELPLSAVGQYDDLFGFILFDHGQVGATQAGTTVASAPGRSSTIEAAFGVVTPDQAQAHRSRCHQAHTCPSDHATYRWYGRAGGRLGRWPCVHRTAEERNRTFRIRVVYGVRVYYCKR
jgi:hypothetical protein